MMVMEVYSRGQSLKASAFYDAWYERGYMNEWPAEKKERIFGIIKSLNLPENGAVLDFGCGNGEFTSVLKKALPKWNVYGTDISSVAIEKAMKRYPDCSFFLTSDVVFINKNFDFLFTHHVLEHVDDIHKTWVEIELYLKKTSFVLHILPCGNVGSFEYKLCMLKKYGIEKEAGSRFYFEENSHLRRLTTRQMNDFAAQYGFCLAAEFYGNQLYGAFDWITSESFGFISQITCPRGALDKASAVKMLSLRIIFFLVKFLRFPANAIDCKKNKIKVYKYYFLFIMLLIFYPFSKLINVWLSYKSNWEWENQKNRENGSEMYLYYARS